MSQSKTASRSPAAPAAAPAAPACTPWCTEAHSDWEEDVANGNGSKVCWAPLAEVQGYGGDPVGVEFIRVAYFDSGTVGSAHVDAQCIQLNQDDWLTPAQARELAAVLVRAAAIVDGEV